MGGWGGGGGGGGGGWEDFPFDTVTLALVFQFFLRSPDIYWMI